MITRADVRLRAWRRSVGASRAVSRRAARRRRAARDRCAIGEAPVGRLGTFSLWRDLDAVRAFAYGRPQPPRRGAPHPSGALVRRGAVRPVRAGRVDRVRGTAATRCASLEGPPAAASRRAHRCARGGPGAPRRGGRASATRRSPNRSTRRCVYTSWTSAYAAPYAVTPTPIGTSTPHPATLKPTARPIITIAANTTGYASLASHRCVTPRGRVARGASGAAPDRRRASPHGGRARSAAPSRRSSATPTPIVVSAASHVPTLPSRAAARRGQVAAARGGARPATTGRRTCAERPRSTWP